MCIRDSFWSSGVICPARSRRRCLSSVRICSSRDVYKRQALRSGKLGYAGLDVFETEPLPADSPLWNLPQAVITPHAAGLCYENHAMLEQLVIENIQNYKAGRPLHNQIL